ncbi:metal cation transporter, zinc (Zn2+)-iron (Fe2+) permease (ZIP) family [Trichinella spiralis]|uniref:metal cation transporter, zinc (Zn2+)-iron (Fe2+) permease (ZIP) family n=1 Tax=Trichinella spiralis TaxID=6334 RepID=UPI0001EFC588|nr:metal cation transporter, zinc (Zn2+)-iron (Fe2+) permease (ZIP) family [Trichinella spiralis]
MAEAFSVLLLSVFMFIGSLMIGIVPTIVSLPENRIKLSGALGAGLLVGTALGVIVPEGIHAIHASPHLNAEGKHFDHYENIPINKDVNVVKQFIPRPKAMGKADLHTAQENWLMHECSAVNFEGKSRIIGVTLLYGFLFMFLIEHITERYTHGNDRGRVRIHHGWMATIGLIVHSATDGIALGAAAFADSSVTFIIFLAVLLHKAPAAFGLSTYLLNEGFEKSKIRKLLIIFSSSAPLATLLTFAGISQAQIGHSASSFLFVATVHILPEVISSIRSAGETRSACSLELLSLLAGSVTEGASGLYYAYHSVIYSLRFLISVWLHFFACIAYATVLYMVQCYSTCKLHNRKCINNILNMRVLFSKMTERNTCSLENLNSATDKRSQFDKQSVEFDRIIHMHPKYSNPAALGLSGYAIASFYFQLYSLEIVGPHLTVWLAIILGGFIQLLAGLQEFYTGNSFAYACFGTFGGIWICFGLLLFHSNNSEVDAIRMDIVYSALFLSATLTMPFMYTVFFSAILMNLVFSIPAHFIAKENAVYLEYLSAGFSMSACLIALYIVGHLIFLGSENEKFWPLGRTFYEIMKQKKTNKKKQNANIENSPQS